jgi:tetratricopeptide (TPR) repeat protein
MGNFKEGQAQCEKALRFATKINDPGSTGFVEYEYAWCYMLQGDGRKGIEHMQSAMRYLEEAQIVGMIGGAWTSLGFGYGLVGQMETALNHMKKGLETDLALGGPTILSFHYAWLSTLYRDSGDLENARSCAEKALELAQRKHYKLVEAGAWLVLGSVIGKVDSTRSAEAEQFILQGMNFFDETGARSWHVLAHLYLGELYVDIGQREKALETLKKAQQMMTEMGMTGYYVAWTQSLLEKLQS